MDEEVYLTLASRYGIVPAAIEDMVGRLYVKFDLEDDSPDPDIGAIEQWITQELKPAAPHLFVQPTATPPPMPSLPDWVKPGSSEKLTFGHQHAAPVVRKQTATHLATADQLQEIEGRSVTERLSKAHEWQQEAQRG